MNGNRYYGVRVEGANGVGFGSSLSLYPIPTTIRYFGRSSTAFLAGCTLSISYCFGHNRLGHDTGCVKKLAADPPSPIPT